MIDPKLPYAYLTTTGRKTRKPRRIEIWFGAKRKDARTIYMISLEGERSHWVRNAYAAPNVKIEIGRKTLRAVARRGSAQEQAPVRKLMRAKYQDSDYDIEQWAKKGLLMAFDIIR